MKKEKSTPEAIKPPVKKEMERKEYTCPLCKDKGEVKDFLTNPNLRVMICKKCGNVFMDKILVKDITAQIKSIQDGERKACPLCKTERDFSEYLFNKEHNFLICPECGNLFMLLEHIKKIQEMVTQKKESRIILP